MIQYVIPLILAFAFNLALSGCSGLFTDKDSLNVKDYENKRTSRRNALDRSPATDSGTLSTLDAVPLPPVKKRILWLPFKNKSPYQDVTFQKAIEDSIRVAFGPLKDYVLVDHPTFLDTDENGVFSEYEPKELFRKARAQGVDGILTGSILEASESQKGDDIGLFRSRVYETVATVELELYDVHTEKKVFRRMETAEATGQKLEFFQRSTANFDPARVRGAIVEATEKTLKELPPNLKRIHWVGHIAKIDIHRYYINSGELSGIRVGQLLKVFGMELPVQDRASGTLIGLAPGNFKGLLKVVDYFGQDGAIAIVHSGAGFREQDRVEVFNPPES